MTNRLETLVATLAISVAAGLLACPRHAWSQAPSAAGVAVSAALPANDHADAELELRRQELRFKEKDLAFREREAGLTRTSDHWKTVATFVSVLVAVLAVVAPVGMGVRSLTAQKRIALDQAKVQFQMKAVDLVLQGSANSKQAKERARALVALFKSDWLPEKFAEGFDHADFRIDAGSSLPRRMELIKTLAASPQNRLQILKDWYVAINGDWWFIDPLLADLPAAERLKLEAAAQRAARNDTWSTEHPGSRPPWFHQEGA